MVYHRTDKIKEYETNAVQREYEIQQAALRNNKLRLLRHEKEGVIEVEAPQVVTEPIAETVVETTNTTTLSSPDTTLVSTLSIIETHITTVFSYSSASSDCICVFEFALLSL